MSASNERTQALGLSFDTLVSGFRANYTTDQVTKLYHYFRSNKTFKVWTEKNRVTLTSLRQFEIDEIREIFDCDGLEDVKNDSGVHVSPILDEKLRSKVAYEYAKYYKRRSEKSKKKGRKEAEKKKKSQKGRKESRKNSYLEISDAENESESDSSSGDDSTSSEASLIPTPRSRHTSRSLRASREPTKAQRSETKKAAPEPRRHANINQLSLKDIHQKLRDLELSYSFWEDENEAVDDLLREEKEEEKEEERKEKKKGRKADEN